MFYVFTFFMEKFLQFTGIVANLVIDNIDTDMIIPKQFLKTITRVGLGSKLFYEMRFNSDGRQNKDFILNDDTFKHSTILLSGKNFGCGSSREHAPWALMDFGIRCIIAESFADIFYNNCFENGILPIVLDKSEIEQIAKITKYGQKLTVNLEDQEISANDFVVTFEIDKFRKNCLLNGLDTIGLTMCKFNKIVEFEKKQKENQPWI